MHRCYGKFPAPLAPPRRVNSQLKMAVASGPGASPLATRNAPRVGNSGLGLFALVLGIHDDFDAAIIGATFR